MNDVEERDVDDTEVSSTDGPEDETAGGSTPSSTAWIAWTVAAALLVVAAVALVQWRSVAGPQADVAAARDAAVDYVETLSTWDASSGLEPTYAALVAGATDDFVPEIDDVFGNDQREALVAADAVSTGTIEEVLTGELRDGTVNVVVVVEQFVVTGPSADPVSRTDRVALLTMTDQTGTWLVDDLEMLSELQVADEEQ